MKVFRKTLVIAMALCLALGCFAAHADTELTESTTETTAQTQVVLDLGEQPTAYTVVIPSQINIDPDTGKGSATITLRSGFVLTDITSLKVRLTDGYTERTDNPSYAKMYLQNVSNASQLSCFITSSVEMFIEKSTDLISVTNKTKNDEDQTATLNFSVTSSSLPSYGTYTGTLTFSVVTE